MCIVDPSDFNVTPDTDIPIILAYNMSHYESMEPLTDNDAQRSKDLIKDYEEGRYRYRKADLPILLNIGTTRPDDHDASASNQNASPKKSNRVQHGPQYNSDSKYNIDCLYNSDSTAQILWLIV